MTKPGRGLQAVRELRLLRFPPDLRGDLAGSWDLPSLVRRQPSFPAPRVPDLDPVPAVEHLAAEHAQAPIDGVEVHEGFSPDDTAGDGRA
jgi:hypothetical protein